MERSSMTPKIRSALDQHAASWTAHMKRTRSIDVAEPETRRIIRDVVEDLGDCIAESNGDAVSALFKWMMIVGTAIGVDVDFSVDFVRGGD